MLRLHLHLAVTSLSDSIRFYSALFAAEPSVLKPDYAKWMLDDPCVNFAISQRGAAPGLDHLGLQVESGAELEALNQRLAAAALPVSAQTGTTCCYAESDKYWTVDPQGIPWEAFHSLSAIPVFGLDAANPVRTGHGCCAPAHQESAP